MLLKLSCSAADRNTFTCSSRSGWLHVHPRRRGQHVWEQKNRLLVQSLAGGAQPAGTDLGETAENVPSHSPAVHPAAAQPGTDAHADSAAQIGDRFTVCMCEVKKKKQKKQLQNGHSVVFFFFSFLTQVLERTKKPDVRLL